MRDRGFRSNSFKVGLAGSLLAWLENETKKGFINGLELRPGR